MGKYSRLKVMCSAAGYYVGREYIEDDGFIEPGSRESGYFKDYEAAEKELKFLTQFDEE